MTDERTPPRRIRVTGLQEAQIAALLELDQASKLVLADHGIPIPPVKTAADFASLAQSQDVRVAEADHVVAGYLAWHDEAPGVVCLEELNVHPDYQRFGIASRLLEDLRERARSHHLEHILVRCWAKALWQTQFLSKAGFVEVDDKAPDKVVQWMQHQEQSPLQADQLLLWAAVGNPPPEPEEEDESESDPDA